MGHSLSIPDAGQLRTLALWLLEEGLLLIEVKRIDIFSSWEKELNKSPVGTCFLSLESVPGGIY